MVDQKSCQNNALEKAVLRYLQEGSQEARAAVVREGELLISYCARLYSHEKPDEDLKQAAYEGILKALRRYDPDRKVKFSTFAVHCMIGEIRHELRDRGPFKVPEWLQNLQVAIIKATEDLAQLNAAMPSLVEITQKINVSEEGIVEAMQAGVVSLDEVDLTKVKSLRYESFKLPIEDRIAVQMSLEKMDLLQQKVIKMIYYEGLTQEQAAKRLGINQRKVSRLLNRCLSEMRVHMA